jgi:hypothetical protein
MRLLEDDHGLLSVALHCMAFTAGISLGSFGSGVAKKGAIWRRFSMYVVIMTEYLPTCLPSSASRPAYTVAICISDKLGGHRKDASSNS